MGLSLNKIADREVRDNMALAQEALTAWLSKPLPAAGERRQRYHEVVAETSFKIGASLYQQEAEPILIREHLGRAATHLLAMIAERPVDEADEADDDRIPYEFEQALCLAVCFGTPDVRASLAKVEEGQYCYPKRAKDKPYVGYLEAAKTFAAGLAADVEALQAVERLCDADTAGKHERVFVRPAVRGLRAAATGNAELWNASIDELVSAHRDEALHGEFKLRPDGFLALPALMISWLGIEKGLSCNVRSPYLPLKLL